MNGRTRLAHDTPHCTGDWRPDKRLGLITCDVCGVLAESTIPNQLRMRRERRMHAIAIRLTRQARRVKTPILGEAFEQVIRR